MKNIARTNHCGVVLRAWGKLSGGIAQVVKMRNQDMGELLGTRIPIGRVYSPPQLYRRSVRCIMQLIKLCKQQGTLGCVVTLEASHSALTALDLLVVQISHHV